MREYWIVDIVSKTVMTHVLSEAGYLSQSYDDQDTEVPVEVLEGCLINLTEAFEES